MSQNQEPYFYNGSWRKHRNRRCKMVTKLVLYIMDILSFNEVFRCYRIQSKFSHFINIERWLKITSHNQARSWRYYSCNKLLRSQTSSHYLTWPTSLRHCKENSWQYSKTYCTKNLVLILGNLLTEMVILSF